MSPSEEAPTYSEPDYAKASGKIESPYYLKAIDKYLVQETQDILEDYSKVPRDQQSKHVHEIRDQAWAIRAYPCTGLGIWLVPFIPLSPAYPTILKRLIAGDTFMDIGCFLGGDMRRLAFDGAPTANMYGIDIVSHWEVGYSLYRDADQFNAHFIEDDFLSSKNPVLQDLMGKVDIISISAVLHQWDLRDQIKAAKRLVTFTKPGALVVGYQIGNVEAKIAGINRQTFNVWRHNPASFTKMWDQVGEETGTKWKTESCLRSWEDMGWDPADMSWMEPGARALDFVVTRTQ